jgi:hypothetical protein
VEKVLNEFESRKRQKDFLNSDSIRLTEPQSLFYMKMDLSMAVVVDVVVVQLNPTKTFFL